LTNSKIQKIIKNTVLILYAYAMQFSIILHKDFQKKIFIMIVSKQKTVDLASRVGLGFAPVVGFLVFWPRGSSPALGLLGWAGKVSPGIR